MHLIKVYVVLFVKGLSPEEYAENLREKLEYSSSARITATMPSQETRLKAALENACPEIYSMDEKPEIKSSIDHYDNYQENMNAYAIAFLKARIREGSDPDYFSIPGYTVNINQAVDRFAGDAALTIMIYK